MGSIAEVLAFDRVEDGGSVVKVDVGGSVPETCEHFADSGDDAQPLPGDFVALGDSPGAGAEQVTGYSDSTEKKAGAGEKRIYARTAAGVLAAEIWLKANGDVEITSLAAGGAITLNGVRIDQDGNITTPGDLTVMSETAPVTVSTHLHPTAMGPSGPPTPGT